ncbi:hypothetical protein EYZ11_004491 [Aspergillus tanneri]|uniref:Uncharacterized protein n=1 Tax=Aspergillus tanneri TaxID=1220188 RepID=A0A4S3JRA9_9EURO|nr:hypothetical protein EYZ11_004491 [Aspergillus tanneri]
MKSQNELPPHKDRLIAVNTKPLTASPSMGGTTKLTLNPSFGGLLPAPYVVFAFYT